MSANLKEMFNIRVAPYDLIQKAKSLGPELEKEIYITAFIDGCILAADTAYMATKKKTENFATEQKIEKEIKHLKTLSISDLTLEIQLSSVINPLVRKVFDILVVQYILDHYGAMVRIKQKEQRK